MWGCDAQREKNTDNCKQSYRSRSLRGWDSAHWISNSRQSRFLSVSFSPRAPGALALGFPQNKPPTGCLSRPLINPSVGSLLRPQPSEQGSNPAKQRLSSCRASERDSQVFFHCSFYFRKKKLRVFLPPTQLQSKCKNKSKLTLLLSFLLVFYWKIQTGS